VFFKRHIFQKRFRKLLGYSLQHLLVHKLKIYFAPRWICIEKSEVPKGGYHPPRSQLLDKIGTKFQRLPPVFRDKESNCTIGNTFQRYRKSEIQDGGLQSGNTNNSTCRHNSNNILTAIPMFSGSSDPIWLLEILCDLTGSWKSKMGAYKPDVPISQLVDKSSITFKWLYLCFRGRAVHYDC